MSTAAMVAAGRRRAPALVPAPARRAQKVRDQSGSPAERLLAARLPARTQRPSPTAVPSRCPRSTGSDRRVHSRNGEFRMSAHPRPAEPRTALTRRATAAIIVIVAMVAYLGQAVLLPAPRAAAVGVGSGSYAEGTPPGGGVPTECVDTPIANPRAHVTANFPAGAIPTNDWWTSLLWRKFSCASVSENLMAHPLS